MKLSDLLRNILRTGMATVVVAALLIALGSQQAWAKDADTHSGVATWYTSSLGTVGAGGKLTHGRSVAITNDWRKKHGISYGSEIYVKWPKGYSSQSGLYQVMDTGCAYRNGKPTLDFYYNSGSVPAKFRRAGVVNVKFFVLKKGGWTVTPIGKFYTSKKGVAYKGRTLKKKGWTYYFNKKGILYKTERTG